MKNIYLKVDYLINIKDISELNFIKVNKGLKIGAVTPLPPIMRVEKLRIEYIT